MGSVESHGAPTVCITRPTDASRSPYYHTADLARDTNANAAYRRVVYTSPLFMQLVLMSIPPGGSIPLERHPGTDQFIRVEQGSGEAVVDGERLVLSDDAALIIPAGAEHVIRNTSATKELKLYTIYSPAEHPADTLQWSSASPLEV